MTTNYAPRWYSKTPPEDDAGGACVIEEHRTADAALRTAEAVLEDGSDGWPEDVLSVQWGLLVPHARAEEYDRTETPDGEYDYICKYRLRSVMDDATAPATLRRRSFFKDLDHAEVIRPMRRDFFRALDDRERVERFTLTLTTRTSGDVGAEEWHREQALCADRERPRRSDIGE